MAKQTSLKMQLFKANLIMLLPCQRVSKAWLEPGSAQRLNLSSTTDHTATASREEHRQLSGCRPPAAGPGSTVRRHPDFCGMEAPGLSTCLPEKLPFSSSLAEKPTGLLCQVKRDQMYLEERKPDLDSH